MPKPSTNNRDNDREDIDRTIITHQALGANVPRRRGVIAPPIGRLIYKLLGWKVVGNIPNIKKAVFICLPHTSNFDGVYAIPLLLGLDLDIKLMGKASLFKYPVLSTFFKWAGILPIDRSKKGSVLQAAIERFKASESLYLGVAPEGTRDYTDKFKTGFYYIAHGANVPIIPVAMDYATKEVRFMTPLQPSGDIESDIAKLIAQYKGVVPKHPERLSQPLAEINKTR